jgi:hypothetical protein
VRCLIGLIDPLRGDTTSTGHQAEADAPRLAAAANA